MARIQLATPFVDISAEHKILLLDDDPDVVELYREILGALPSKPKIFTATSGARAIHLLEQEDFTLLISDLNMPKMDGLQVLSIVRRRFPHLRTAVLTSVADEQFRARAYAMGIDLFLEKPSGNREIRFMLDCIESLLGQDETDGFRGVQHKSLVDIVQLECLSQSSSVLRITHGIAEGKIWIQDGDVIDASSGALQGEDAFKRILSWKTGNFEILPAEPAHPRTISTSYQGLLLETAQSLDESESAANNPSPGDESAAAGPKTRGLGDFHGVEFVMEMDDRARKARKSWGTEDPDEVAAWTQTTVDRLQKLGEALQAGNFNRATARGPRQHLALVTRPGATICVGFHRSFTPDRIRETLGKIIAQWAS